MINKIKFILISGFIIFTGCFLLWVHNMHNKVIRLEKENQTLIETQKIQENIITISDTHIKNKQLLDIDRKQHINNIKKKDIKDEQDFLRISECIFNNFGTINYECK